MQFLLDQPTTLLETTTFQVILFNFHVYILYQEVYAVLSKPNAHQLLKNGPLRSQIKTGIQPRA